MFRYLIGVKDLNVWFYPLLLGMLSGCELIDRYNYLEHFALTIKEYDFSTIISKGVRQHYASYGGWEDGGYQVFYSLTQKHCAEVVSKLEKLDADRTSQVYLNERHQLFPEMTNGDSLFGFVKGINAKFYNDNLSSYDFSLAFFFKKEGAFDYFAFFHQGDRCTMYYRYHYH